MSGEQINHKAGPVTGREAVEALIAELKERIAFNSETHGQDAWWRGQIQGMKDALYEIERLADALEASQQAPAVDMANLASAVGHPSLPDDVDESKTEEYANGWSAGFNACFENVRGNIALQDAAVVRAEGWDACQKEAESACSCHPLKPWHNPFVEITEAEWYAKREGRANE